MAGGAYPPPPPHGPGGFQPPGGPPGYGPPPQGGPPGYAAPGGYAGPPAYGAAPIAQPGAPYGIDPKTGLPFSDKQKMIAFLLQLMLGAFGAGRFYTGHIGIAIAQIAVTWITCGFGAIWPLIDGIMMLTGSVTDVDGRPLRD